MARELVEQRKHEGEAGLLRQEKVTLDDLFSQIQQGEMKDLNIIVKADVQGSAEAVKPPWRSSPTRRCASASSTAASAPSTSPTSCWPTSNAIIVGFNVRPDAAAKRQAARTRWICGCTASSTTAINEIEAP